MKTDVLVEPLSDNRWRAIGLGHFSVSAEGTTRAEAIHNFQIAAAHRLPLGASVVSVEVESNDDQRAVFVESALTLYRETIQAQVEPEHLGKYIVIDAESGDYEVDSDDLQAEDRLLSRRREAVPVLLCIGRNYAYEL